jgi:penicillin-binding protein 1C
MMKAIIRNKFFRAVCAIILIVLIFDLIFPFKANPHYSTIVTSAEGKVLHAFLNREDKWRMYAELSEITPTLTQTILFKEDKYFYYHLGINPISIVRAAALNIITNRRTSGASTITMQVVRLLQPRKRTYSNKLIEIFRALQLELHYSKDEILQLYLNLMPYSSNIEGIKSASILYFQKPPQLLSLAEITTLTIIPNRPSSLKLGVKNQYIVQERNRWLRRFQKSKLYDNTIIEDAINEPLTVRRNEAPKLLPHLAIRLKNENPDKPIIKTNIKLNQQLQIERLVSNYVNRLRTMNIHNAAVVVINNQTMNVETYVGSADFGNAYDGGQVDGVQAVRSPGSTLKPLVYALAFDKGLIVPQTSINDVLTNFGGFEPENFDRRFNGKVTIEFSLANSLNIPAVKVLKQLTPSILIDILQKSDFKTIKKQSKELGLSMVLGGCGTTLEELTRHYATFANGGRFKELNYLKNNKKDKGVEITSPEAAFLINTILTQITRPDLPNNFDNTYRLPKIAWKTGTSSGKKDAWSIGYNKNYTIGVWVGNFSGEGVPELSGADIATPLLFTIFNIVEYNTASGWFGQTKNVAYRKVCAESGDLPNDFCKNQVLDYAIMGVSPTRLCQHLKYVLTNQKRTVSYCTQCVPDSGSVRNLYPNISPELANYYNTKQIPYLKIPPHNGNCTRIFEENAPEITSPNDGSEYFIDPTDHQQLQLASRTANDVQEVYWYVNDKLLKKVKSQEVLFFSPPSGKVKISCSDDKGRSADIFIVVK